MVHSDIRNAQSTDPGSLFVLAQYLKQLPEVSMNDFPSNLVTKSAERTNRITSYYDIIVNRISGGKPSGTQNIKELLASSAEGKVKLKEDPLDTIYRTSHFALGQIAASHNSIEKVRYHFWCSNISGNLSLFTSRHF
jgi:hypothetical protein